jgi:MFS family permease
MIRYQACSLYSQVIWPAVAAYLLGVFMTSLCSEVYQFMLAQGILGGIGMGGLQAPPMAAVGQYFNKRRGAAMGLAVAGSSISRVVFPIALSEMLDESSLGLAGASASAVSSFSCSSFPRGSVSSRACFLETIELLPPSAFKEPLYLGISMSTRLAGYLPSILNGASFFDRVIPGIAADIFGRLNMLSASGLGTGILTFCFPKVHSNAAIIAFAALYGFTYGGIVSLMTVTLAMVPKNARDIGTYMGMGMFVISFAALIGPPIDGAFVSHYGGFSEVSIFSGTVVIVGGLGAWATKATTE